MLVCSILLSRAVSHESSKSILREIMGLIFKLKCCKYLQGTYSGLTYGLPVLQQAGFVLELLEKNFFVFRVIHGNLYKMYTGIAQAS